MNGSRYDNLFLVRALIEHGITEKITYTAKDGSQYTKPLLKGTPTICYKSVNEPIGLTFQYSCPFEVCVCQTPRKTSIEARMKGEKRGSCPFARKIKVIDTMLFIPASLSSQIEDLHASRISRGISLEEAFPSCYKFGRSQGYSESMLQTYVKGKFFFPYEYAECWSKMANQKEPPPPTAFSSILRDSEGLTTEEYAEFVKSWEMFEVDSLSTLLKIYNIGRQRDL